MECYIFPPVDPPFPVHHEMGHAAADWQPEDSDPESLIKFLGGVDGAKPNGEREVHLQVLVRVPTYGKPEQDMKAAERVLRNLKTGLGHQISAALVFPDGSLVEISETDDRL